MITLTDSTGKPTTFSDEFIKATRFGKNIGTHEEVVFELSEKKRHTVGGVDKGPLYRNFQLPNNDEIYDPWANKKIKVQYIQDGHTADKPGMIMFDKNEQSKITITGWNHKHFDLLWFLRISSFNKTNPLNSEDRSQRCVFQETEPEKDAKAKLYIKREKRQTEDAIEKAKHDELAAWMQAVGIASTPVHDQNKVMLMDWIDLDPKNFKKFQSISSDVRTVIANLIKRAEHKGVIQYIKNESRWRIIGPNIEIVKVLPGQEEYDAIISFLHAEIKGQNMLTIIEAECEGKPDVKEKEEPPKTDEPDTEKERMAAEIKQLQAQLAAKPKSVTKAKPKKATKAKEETVSA